MGELERGNMGPARGVLVVQRALIEMTCSWRFYLESKKPGELVVVFTNAANYQVGFFCGN